MKLPTAPINRDLRQAVGYQAELRHSQPGFALLSFAVVRIAIHPCGKSQGILAKPNKIKDLNEFLNLSFSILGKLLPIKKTISL
jgi:hypothetical protein